MTTSLVQFQQDCKTGDIVLCSGTRWLSYIIEWFFHSPISHVGVVYRDEGDNVFILESKFGFSSETNGVVLTPLDEFVKRYKAGDYSAVYTRKLNVKRNQYFNDTVKYILKIVCHKKYDTNPFDWIKILTNEQNYQHTNEFFCSALVAFCFIKLGVLDAELPWSIISPDVFSSRSTSKHQLKFNKELGDDVLITF